MGCAEGIDGGAGHPFYERLNELSEGGRFDTFVEALSAKFYAPRQFCMDASGAVLIGRDQCRVTHR
jgi:hypothetical protein